jgi:formate hydrogenlyase subunit 3/multisubunit Na+/H+ antiporter MnhD subunit
MESLWDLQVIWIPLVGGALVACVWILAGWAARRAGRLGDFLTRVAQAVALVSLACVAWQAVALFLGCRGGPKVWLLAENIDLGAVVLAVAFRADALSTLIVLAASAIALLVVLYSLRAMEGTERQPLYYVYILLTVAVVNAAALASTFLVLVVAWEVATVLLYLLIGMGRPEGRASAMKTFAILGLADICLLLGVALLLGLGELGKDLALGGTGAAIATDTPLKAAAWLLIVAAALAKAGAMPLHTWIPAASEDAPTPVFALLPAALDKLLGIYLLARITFGIFQIGQPLATVLMVIGAGTILFAVMMAMIQHDLKRLLAFHAVSQVGYMVLGMGLAAWVLAAGREWREGVTPAQQAAAAIAFAGGLFHMLNNAIYKCTLFLAAGSVERIAGTTDLDRLGGLARRLPVTFVCCLVAALAISGVPPMNGFVSKWLVYQGALEAGSGLALACLVVAVFGSALTLASFIKVVHSVFLGTRGLAVPPDGQGPRESLTMAAPMAVLALACVGLGIGGGWAVDVLILPAGQAVGVQPAGIETAGGWVLELAGGRGFWSPALATGLIGLGVLVGLALYAVGRTMRVRVVPNFVGGEDASSDAIWHVSGTGFYETIRRLPLLEWAFRDASQGAFDVYRLTGRYGATLVGRLSAWHTGLLAVYASWILIGLAVLVIVMALH